MKENPYIIPVLFAGTLEVVALIVIQVLLPDKDNSVIIGGVTLAVGQVISFLVSNAQAQIAAETARAAKEQVQAMSTQVKEVNAKAEESVVTSRTGLTALVKQDDLVEFDRLADAFSKTTLTYEETLRFVALLQERLQDDLTIQQLTAAKRIIEITQRELATEAIHTKTHVSQSTEDMAISKKIQRQAEIEQRAAGSRKSTPAEAAAEAEAAPASRILTMPSVVAAANAAAESAEKTKAATQETVIAAAREIEKEREENKSERKE